MSPIPEPRPEVRSPVDWLIRFCLENKLVVALLLFVVCVWGALVAPFGWSVLGLPRDPVPVDAIPDLGENQQIVFADWQGRSPQDVEDQVTYPLTVALLGVPGVQAIRSTSMFGFASIYVVFREDVELYWARSRILEKLSSLPAGTLPQGVQPALGPDATALGQVFWYTLEGRDPQGRPCGGWDPHELRSVQDFQVRYALAGVEGVAEVASVGGFVKEYQVDVDPDAMRAHGVRLEQVFQAVRASNLDVGARTIELNRVEYAIRGLGFLQSVADLEQVVVKVADGVPIQLRNVAKVALGPAQRRGALDKGGVEAVGGVVVVRFGANPLAVIERVKKKVAEIAPGLPARTLPDGTLSRVAVVPFYDRTALIHETLGTLSAALTEELYVMGIVVLVMLLHLRSAVLIASLLPLSILLCFIAMKAFGVEANVVALAGIAIAIGEIADVGIVLCESILERWREAAPGDSRLGVVFRGASEVGSAVLTAVLTTVVSFLPVLTMEGAEGKLFKPLAWTKTFAMVASIVLALVVVAPLAHLMFREKLGRPQRVAPGFEMGRRIVCFAIAALIVTALAGHWEPLGPDKKLGNLVFAGGSVGGLLLLFWGFRRGYERLLRWCLAHKWLFLSLPCLICLFGAVVWLGFGRVLGFVPAAAAAIGVERASIEGARPWVWASHTFPGLGKEFMPELDEGSFLLMPVTMPHASIGEAVDVLKKQDLAIRAIPEVSSVVGKVGRVESPLDPAPVDMIETVVNYRSEYTADAGGRRLTFQWDEAKGDFARDAQGELVPDPDGRPFRQWRPHIRKPDDIWREIQQAARIPGTTTASKLGPIKARLVMLQTGMRANFGVKVLGPSLETIERVAVDIERLLREVPAVDPATVIADRVVGKPYLEIEIDRAAIARYGLTIQQVQETIEVALGGERLTTTVEGRERYPVRVRYLRELRDRIEDLGRILVPGEDGAQVPLGQVASVGYRPGPQMIKSEDTFLVAYVLFDARPGQAEVDVVEACQQHLEAKLESGELVLPAGTSYRFSGNYENQVRAAKRLQLVLPMALGAIFLIVWFQLRSVASTALVFSGVFVAWAGGFIMLWLYGQDWWLDFELFGVSMRDLFQVKAYNLSVAVWVGFLALFGVTTDDGVLQATFLKQSFERNRPDSIAAIREAVVQAGNRRIRACLMTTATTILALFPVLTSTGKGSDILVPMAIPAFGGMAIEMISLFIVPTVWCAREEWRWRRAR